jgi:hypothetical protein
MRPKLAVFGSDFHSFGSPFSPKLRASTKQNQEFRIMTSISQKLSETSQPNEKSSYLRNAMRADAVFGVLSGLFFIIDAGFIAQFLQAGDSFLYMELGLLLLIHSAGLFFFSRTPNVPRWFVIYALAADAVWMLLSIVLMISNSFGIPEVGKWAIFFVNEIVLAFAVLKFIGMRRLS